METFDICQTDYSIQSKFSIYSLFWSHTWKYNIQVNDTLTKAKEKGSSMQFDILIFLSSSPFQCPDNKCHKQK